MIVFIFYLKKKRAEINSMPENTKEARDVKNTKHKELHEKQEAIREWEPPYIAAERAMINEMTEEDEKDAANKELRWLVEMFKLFDR